MFHCENQLCGKSLDLQLAINRGTRLFCGHECLEEWEHTNGIMTAAANGKGVWGRRPRRSKPWWER